MTSVGFDYSFAILHDDRSSSWCIRFIASEIVRRDIFLGDYIVSGDDNLLLSLPDCTTVVDEMVIPVRGATALSYEDISSVTYILHGFNVPVDLCSEILREIDAALRRAFTGLLGGVLEIRVARIRRRVFRQNENPRVDRVAQRWIEAYCLGPKPVPADKSAIESLEKFEFLGGGSSAGKDKEGCMICMDEFENGSKISALPCGHVYHGGCIGKWLQINHMCPLCRFPMPH